jgi:N-glycosylase/DNA lyase
MISQKYAPCELHDGLLPYIKLENVELFDVSKAFDCGQCFRFDRVYSSRHENEFAGCAHGKYISVAQDAHTIYIYNVTAREYYDVFEKYLALDRDYSAINADILSLSDNPTLKDAVSTSSGIRILKQDEWEAICSFIISQNNNIPRIKKIIASLSQRCGRKLDISLMEGHIAESHMENERNFYSFPTADEILPLGVDGLFALKTGFRAKYIFDAAERMVSGELNIDFLKNTASTQEASSHLCSVKGIGPKVAACALLFGFSRLDAFPVDVWIKKVMAKYFDENFNPSALGQYAGVAQQYLFYYERYLINEKGENKK